MKNRYGFMLIVVIVLITTKIAISQNAVYRNGVFLYDKGDKSAFNDKFKEVSSLNFYDGKLILVKKVNLDDTRINPDKTIFYKTSYGIIIDKGDDVKINEIETVAYTDKNYNPGMTPCMLFDNINNVVTIFSNSKNSNSSNYGMDGFTYRIDLTNKTWTKENIFNSANWGWFSFFGGSDNGNPELWHFSFAGYYAMKSTRNSDGSWTNSNLGSYKPEIASNEYPNRKNILVASTTSVDRMSGSNSSTSSSSSSSNQLSEDEVAISTALILGTVLWQGAKWLVNNSSSSSSSTFKSSSSSNSSTSSSSNTDMDKPYAQVKGTFKDTRDGQTYKTVKIGTQIWMAENLNYKPSNYSWCYENESNNCKIYGRLYTWQIAKNVCPTVWHLPSEAEWKKMVEYLGGDNIASGKMKEEGTNHWGEPNKATNSSGFTALAGGVFGEDKMFNLIGICASFWTSTEIDQKNANTCNLFNWDTLVTWGQSEKKYGSSVRCIKD